MSNKLQERKHMVDPLRNEGMGRLVKGDMQSGPLRDDARPSFSK
jgi:hypothetical protein